MLAPDRCLGTVGCRAVTVDLCDQLASLIGAWFFAINPNAMYVLYYLPRYLAALYKNGDIELPAALAEDLPPSAKKARTEVRRLLLPSS